MGLDTIGGLPVHALVVHVSVVLMPVSAIGAVLIALKPSWSRRFGVIVVLLAAVGTIATVVSKESGERLAGHVGLPEPHAQLGDRMPVIAAALFVVVLVLWLFDRGIPANRSRPWWLIVLAIVVLLVALFTAWWTIRVGDSGARAVWEPILRKSAP